MGRLWAIPGICYMDELKVIDKKIFKNIADLSDQAIVDLITNIISSLDDGEIRSILTDAYIDRISYEEFYSDPLLDDAIDCLNSTSLGDICLGNLDSLLKEVKPSIELAVNNKYAAPYKPRRNGITEVIADLKESALYPEESKAVAKRLSLVKSHFKSTTNKDLTTKLRRIYSYRNMYKLYYEGILFLQSNYNKGKKEASWRKF